ncbi:MAG: hypothetical protein MSS48_08080 [Clostridiales bacterium]|nr:hypothetical protein [Clostridiales bacterium]MCI7680149.1 hypothetical protein [Clostridiales bacterium]
MSYFDDLAQIVLETVYTHAPLRDQELFDALSETDFIKIEISRNPDLVEDTLMVVDSLIDSGYINGTISPDIPTKSRRSISITGLTDVGKERITV